MEFEELAELFLGPIAEFASHRSQAASSNANYLYDCEAHMISLEMLDGGLFSIFASIKLHNT